MSSDNPLFEVPVGDRPIERIDRGWKEGASRIEAQFAIDCLDPDKDRFLGHLLRYVTDHLDIKASWDLKTIRVPSDINAFNEKLRSTADILYQVAESRSKGKSDAYGVEGFLSIVRTVLYENRLLHWHAEALSHIGLSEAGASDPQPSPDETPNSKTPGGPMIPDAPIRADTPVSELIAQRQGLLAEYKAATGAPSNRQIYLANNCPIHKPEFYAWINGELPGSSATAINFERFLAERKRPVIRKD